MEEEKKPAEVVDITGLAGRFKNRAELQKYCEMLFRSFKETVEKLKKLEDENKHLKELLTKSVPTIVTPQQQNEIVTIVVPNEQAIAEIQLNRLKEIAVARQLTLDETKQYDLLAKNLYLAKGRPTSVLSTRHKKLEDIEEAELIQIAKKDE